MLAQYDWEGATPDPDDPSEISDDFTQFDRITDLDTTDVTRTTISFLPDGTVTADTLTMGNPGNFPQIWNTTSPTVINPEDYEIQLVKVSGDDIIGQMNFWMNLFYERSWALEANDIDLNKTRQEGVYDISVREVGRPENVKTKRIEMIVEIFP